MTITITVPSAANLRLLLALLGVFVPNATVKVGDHVEHTLPNQVGLPVGSLVLAKQGRKEVQSEIHPTGR